MLNPQSTVLILIDIQGRLAHLMHDHQILFDKLQQIVKGCQILDIPIIWLEQNPLGLGPTIPELKALLKDMKPISKQSFSCCGNDAFQSALQAIPRHQVLITGIEAHICVYQTVCDLLNQDKDKEVHVVTDAVSSRTARNRDLALQIMQQKGAQLTSVEMALFELLKTADNAHFRSIVKLIK